MFNIKLPLIPFAMNILFLCVKMNSSQRTIVDEYTLSVQKLATIELHNFPKMKNTKWIISR